MWSYPIKAAMVIGASYELSFWARGTYTYPHMHSVHGGVQGHAPALFIGMEALYGKANVTCPDGSYGPCSYTPQVQGARYRCIGHA